MDDGFRMLIIDDQETIHQDYHKIIGQQDPGQLELGDIAASMFDEGTRGRDQEFPGFKLDDAFQGQEGLERVRQAVEAGSPYAVAFVDIRMPPGWDGVETVRRIWEVDPEILIVLCSAYSDYSWSDITRQLGRSDRFLILKKPFETIEVRQSAMALAERWKLARTDVLTGLLNRRAFFERLRSQWKFDSEKPLSCLMLDIDFFKRVNDTRGHLAGDEILKAVAHVIQEAAGQGNAIARYGGEEISLLLPGYGEEEAAAIAESLRVRVSETLIDAGGSPLSVTASLGVATRTADLPGPTDLVDRADQALRVAKQSGRNRVVSYGAIGEAGVSRFDCDGSHPFENLTASQVMSPVMAVLRQDAPISEAIPLFCEHRAYSAPVVDSDGHLAGIVAEKDILQLMFSRRAWKRPIADAMQRHVVSYDEDAPVSAIFDFLCRVSIHRVVIVREGQPVGLVSRTSLLRWFGNWMAAQGEVSALLSPGEHWRQTSSQLLALARRLHDCVTADAQQDPIAAVIDTSSKMQSLLVGMLSAARWQEVPAEERCGLLLQRAFEG